MRSVEFGSFLANNVSIPTRGLQKLSDRFAAPFPPKAAQDMSYLIRKHGAPLNAKAHSWKGPACYSHFTLHPFSRLRPSSPGEKIARAAPLLSVSRIYRTILGESTCLL